MFRRKNQIEGLTKDPLWYQDAIIYEAHVRAFLDSNADGIGDFRGLTQKLDYLHDLGVTAIWLLPFYPSPLKDDGYDIADYCAINPIYGTLKDFKQFLQEAHKRQLRVITELVLNHTSDQHPWFQRSRRAKPGSAWRDFYVWNATPDKYKEARIIFRDFEPSNWTWDPLAQAYYWHRFYSHQPDLNYDHPQVHKEVIRVLDFWLDLGVDGFRLDAVPYLFEREGTSCENLRETHDYLKSLRKHVDEKYGDRMLLAEANQWPEEAVTYFGSGKGDECHMAFHFPLMPRIFMAVRMEDRVPVVDILEQTPPIPPTSQWALFLRNHDELTLEMVTDEERDYMYRVYANDAKARINLGIRRRLAPLLEKDRKRIELLYLLLFSLPGTPVLYYGDEIGMGDNVFLGDRNGVRTPMQWSSDKNAGFSRASPQALYLPIILDPEYHYEAVNVEAEQRNPHSLWWWMKRVLTLRKRYQAFGRGTVQFLRPENRKILAFIRRFENETILIVANLSRFAQATQLDLSAFRQTVPIELFGRTPFPPIGEKPYFLTLGPHLALWFSLEPVAPRQPPPGPVRAREMLTVAGPWDNILHPNRRASLENCLARGLKDQPWFAGKDREIKAVQIRDVISVPLAAARVSLLMLLVDYREGDPEEYLLPVAFATGEKGEQLERECPQLVVAGLRLESPEGQGLLYDAVASKSFCSALLDALTRKRSFSNSEGELLVHSSAGLRDDKDNGALMALAPAKAQSDPGQTRVIFGEKYLLKLFRRLEAAPNPELEVGQFLTEKNFPHIMPVAGSLEYKRRGGADMTVGILTRYSNNARDAWTYTLDTLGRYFERVGTTVAETKPEPLPDLERRDPPDAVVGMIGTYLESARLLGQRAGQLHVALGSEPDNPHFAPEPFTPFYQRALYQSMRNRAVQNLRLLTLSLDRLPPAVRPLAEKVARLEGEIVARLRMVHEKRIDAKRIRCHGDFHLGQVLYTGKDFIIINYEGEPSRSVGERRLKRPPLRDVASMVRSFDYAVHVALARQFELGTLQEDRLAQVEPWVEYWHRWVSAVFLKAYLEVLRPSDLLPRLPEQLGVLLEAHLLERSLSELGYELHHNPARSKIPLRQILQLMEPKPVSA